MLKLSEGYVKQEIVFLSDPTVFNCFIDKTVKVMEYKEFFSRLYN